MLVLLKKRVCAFTLIEIVVTIIILGVIATLAYPQLNKLMLRSRERDMIMQGMLFRSANEMYKAKHGHYWYPTDAGVYADSSSRTEIEQALGIELDDDDGNYTYNYIVFRLTQGSTPQDTYGFTVTWKDGTSQEFSVLVDQDPVTQLAARMPERYYSGPAVFKPAVFAWQVADDLLAQKKWMKAEDHAGYSAVIKKCQAPSACYVVLNQFPHDVPCCCTGTCPTLTGCTGTDCGCE